MAALDSDFVDSVTTEMRPGMTAIIVEADEKKILVLDDIIALGGGRLYSRRSTLTVLVSPGGTLTAESLLRS